MGPDVKECSKMFPRAILYAAGMQTLINGTIHLVAAGATDPALYPDWEPGYLRYGNVLLSLSLLWKLKVFLT